LLEVRFGQAQGGQFFTRKEGKSAFSMRRGQTGEARFHFKEKHQPMCLTSVAVLAHEAREMEVGGLKLNPKFFPGLAARRGIRRLTTGGVEFPATRTPKAKVRLLRALHQQHAILFVETIEQRRNLVREGRHSYFTKAAYAASASTLCLFA
jgi:hypothetical protein